jgi:hypothetical protein
MNISLTQPSLYPHFDRVTERCAGCDGHWRCYCEDTWNLYLSRSEMSLICSLLKENKSPLSLENQRLIDVFIDKLETLDSDPRA